jgi:hypothetical protein
MDNNIFTATLDWLYPAVWLRPGHDAAVRRGLDQERDRLSWLPRLVDHDECKPGGRQTGKRAGRTFCGDGPITNPYSANKPRI